MAIATSTVTLVAGTWTLIVSGAINQGIIQGTPYGFQFYGGTSKPADTVNGIPVNWPGGAVSLGALASGDHVYGKPLGAVDVAVTVMSY